MQAHYTTFFVYTKQHAKTLHIFFLMYWLDCENVYYINWCEEVKAGFTFGYLHSACFIPSSLPPTCDDHMRDWHKKTTRGQTTKEDHTRPNDHRKLQAIAMLTMRRCVSTPSRSRHDHDEAMRFDTLALETWWQLQARRDDDNYKLEPYSQLNPGLPHHHPAACGAHINCNTTTRNDTPAHENIFFFRHSSNASHKLVLTLTLPWESLTTRRSITRWWMMTSNIPPSSSNSSSRSSTNLNFVLITPKNCDVAQFFPEHGECHDILLL